ncbi:MAG: methyltransferase domain-containing protein [Bacteroidota bacterium]
MTPDQLKRGLAYAKRNFLEEKTTHLWLDKKIIKEFFDLTDKSVLDFGCGMGGMTLWYASQWKCHVHGVDIDEHHIKIARALHQEYDLENVSLMKEDILRSNEQEIYDVIFLNDVVEHIPLPALEEILNRLSSLLKQDGTIYLSYPPWHSPYASHINRAIKLPWVQFLPDAFIISLLERHNKKTLSKLEGDLIEVYLGLNKITYRKLMKIINKTDLILSRRISHSFFNKFKKLKNTQLHFFPFNFLVTKEVVFLKKGK